MRRLVGRICSIVAAAATLVGMAAMVGPTSAGAASNVVYSATLTVPAPPASNFAGANGGGDGWAVGLTSSQVFNVFHHSGVTQVNCHNQSDATACWTGPKTVTDPSGHNFSTSIAPGLFVSQDNGHLYVPVVQTTDDIAGVLCIDTTQPASALGSALYCGFTALTPAGQGSDNAFSANGLSAPVQVGSRWYIMDEVPGTPTGAEDKMLCFDLTSKAACSNQPYPVDLGGATYSSGSYSFPLGFAGSKLFVQVVGTTTKLACFDTTNPTVGTCGGSWPVSVSGGQGGPFPLLNASGNVLGVCDPLTTIVCFDLTGASVATPAGMSSAISNTIQYNSPPVVIGPRVYVPEAGADQVGCYDYNLGSSCQNFPKAFQNLGLLYSVNSDPQRPTCIWVNADNGSAQIQNFDAFSGGACGQGAIRVLSSSIVVPTDQCVPASYTSLQVVNPARNAYSTGTVDFQDASGNPIPGIATHNLDNTGTTSLTDLNLSTKNAFPQFLISLNNPSSAISSVTVKLVWTGTFNADCVKGDTQVTGLPQVGGEQGVRLAALDAGVFSFGSKAFYGSLAGGHLASPIVGIADTPSGLGYMLVGTDGGTFAFGDAHYRGSAPALGINVNDIVGLALTRTANGYWELERNGGVLSFGDATFHGSAFGIVPDDVVGLAPTPTGNGYWMVERNGGVLSFGDATFHGSAFGLAHDDVVGMVPTGTGHGYWLVEGNGGVLSFGDATFYGSAFGLRLGGPIVGMALTPTKHGYWLAGSDGGVMSYGDARFPGSLGGTHLNAPVVGISS